MNEFREKFIISNQDRILDIGGTLFNWDLIPEQPHLTMLNLTHPSAIPSDISWVIADGRYLPFQEQSFDIVYSNSVIEHLGNLENQILFASECIRVGRRYYIQTPNKWFFMEPHYIAPFIHWLPKNLQKNLIRYFTIRGWVTRPTPLQCDIFIQELHLLSKREMIKLFPDSEVWLEKFLGFVKSISAVKSE